MRITRQYYRLAQKEKLRLTSLGYDQELITAICRYLSGFNKLTGTRIEQFKPPEGPQMWFEFVYF